MVGGAAGAAGPLLLFFAVLSSLEAPYPKHRWRLPPAPQVAAVAGPPRATPCREVVHTGGTHAAARHAILPCSGIVGPSWRSLLPPAAAAAVPWLL